MVTPPQQPDAATSDRHQRKRTCSGVGHIIPTAWSVVDRVFAATCDAPLKSLELGTQQRKIEQDDTSAVYWGDKLAVDV